MLRAEFRRHRVGMPFSTRTGVFPSIEPPNCAGGRVPILSRRRLRTEKMCAVLALDWGDKGSCCFRSLICDGLFFLKSCVELASSSLLTFRIVCHCCLVSGGNDSQHARQDCHWQEAQCVLLGFLAKLQSPDVAWARCTVHVVDSLPCHGGAA